MSIYDEAIGDTKEEPGIYDRAVGIMQQSDRALGESLTATVTGEDRQTDLTRALPELLGGGLFEGEDQATLARITPALSTTFDPQEVADIVTANFPNIGVSFNLDGNGEPFPILTNNATGAVVQVNSPGLSGMDALQLSAAGAAFTPAARAANVGLRGVGRVAGQTAATETALQANQAAQGGEFNATDVVVSGVAGGVFRGVGQALAKRFPKVFGQDVEVTDETVQLVREESIKLGIDPADLTDDAIAQVVRDARRAVTPEEGAALQGEAEFGIPLTQGQRTLDDAALSFEDGARSGRMGDDAQRIVRGFEDEQQTAVQRAVDSVRTELGGSRTRADAGAVISERILTAEDVSSQIVADAYGEVGRATLSNEGVSGLIRSVRRAVIGLDKDRNLPATRSILKAARAQDRAQSLPGVRGTDLRRIEQMRKRINTGIDSATNNADRAQLVGMRRAFDQYLDDAVRNALFDGDETAIAALKEARGLFAEYASRFRVNPTRTRSGRELADKPGEFIEFIVEGNPTGEQVANTLFGASGFGNQHGRALAARAKEILGTESSGWEAIRGEAFRRLVQTNTVNGQEVVSGQKSIKALNDALDKNGSMLREVFDGDEIRLMRRLFAQIQRTQPQLVRSRENPSGTSQALVSTLVNMVSRTAGVLGVDFGLTSAGVQVGRGVRNSSRAANTIRPFDDVARPRELPVAAGVTATR